MQHRQRVQKKKKGRVSVARARRRVGEKTCSGGSEEISRAKFGERVRAPASRVPLGLICMKSAVAVRPFFCARKAPLGLRLAERTATSIKAAPRLLDVNSIDLPELMENQRMHWLLNTVQLHSRLICFTEPPR